MRSNSDMENKLQEKRVSGKDIPVLKTGKEVNRLLMELAGFLPEDDRAYRDKKIQSIKFTDTLPPKGDKKAELSESDVSVIFPGT